MHVVYDSYFQNSIKESERAPGSDTTTRFYEFGIQELWVRFGIKDGRRNIPIHKLGQQLDGGLC